MTSSGSNDICAPWDLCSNTCQWLPLSPVCVGSGKSCCRLLMQDAHSTPLTGNLGVSNLPGQLLQLLLRSSTGQGHALTSAIYQELHFTFEVGIDLRPKLESVKQAAKGETTQGPQILHGPAQLSLRGWLSLPQQFHASFQYCQTWWRRLIPCQKFC